MKKINKALLITSMAVVTIGSIKILNNNVIQKIADTNKTSIQAYNHNATNILDNVFEQNEMTILPFIFENTNQNITKEKLISDFENKGLTVTSITSKNSNGQTVTVKNNDGKEIVATGTEIRVSQSNIVYTVLVYGDVNRSGIVDLIDAQKIMLHAQNATKYPLNAIEFLAANISNDDSAINLIDAQRLVMLKLKASTKLVRNEPISLKESDTIPPVISINGQVVTDATQRITIKVGDSYTEPTVTATDNIDGNVTVTKTGDIVDSNRVGTYTVVYTASDAKGNTTTLTRVVTVEQKSSGGGSTTTPITTVDIESIDNGEIKKDEEVIKKLIVRRDGTKIPVKNSEVSIIEIPQGVTISKLDAEGNKIGDNERDKEVDSLKFETTIDTRKDITIKMEIKGIQKVLSFTIPNSIEILIDDTCELQIGQTLSKNLKATSGKTKINYEDITVTSTDANLDVTLTKNSDGTADSITITASKEKIKEDKTIEVTIIAFEDDTERKTKKTIEVSVYKPIPKSVKLGDNREAEYTVTIYDTDQGEGKTRVGDDGLVYTLVPISLFADISATKQIFADNTIFTESTANATEKVLVIQPKISAIYQQSGKDPINREVKVLSIKGFEGSVSGEVKYIGIARKKEIKNTTYNPSDLNGIKIELNCENVTSATITLQYTP